MNSSRLMVPALAALCALATTYGCKGSEAGKNRGLQSGDSDAPVVVELATLANGPIEDALRFSSTLRAETQVAVLARTVGQIRQRNFEEGDTVKRNAVLARIEADEQSSAIKRIDADLAQARRNLERDTALHKRGVVSDQALERSKFELERLEIARRDARRSLGYTTVRSPIAGTVTQRYVKYGDLVAPNQPLYEITDFDSLLAEVFVPEKDIHRVVVGGSARLQLPSSGSALPGGTVERIAPIVDPRSGTVKVTLDLPVTEGLRPGMFVDVHLVVASEDSALLIPRQALVYDNDEPYAFRLRDGNTVERVKVSIAIEDRGFVKPNGGFKVGDQVVVAGQVGLKDGALVKAADAPAAKGAESPSEPEAPSDPSDPSEK